MKIKARSIPDKFRRAGMTFTKKPEEYDVDEKTLAVLKAEPMLVVEVLHEKPVAAEKQAPKEVPVEDKGKVKGGGKG
jgi:hypothetical protein